MSSVTLPADLQDFVPPPTIATSRWSGLLPADEHTLRAAIFTCSKNAGSKLKLYRTDQRILLGEVKKSGWIVKLATDGRRVDTILVRQGSRYAGGRVRVGFWKLLTGIFTKRQFSDAEMEQVLRAFLKGEDALPTFVAYAHVDWH